MEQKVGGKVKSHASISFHKRGANMEVVAKNVHSMNELSKGDRFKKCLNCGSEEHRAKDCDRPNKAGKSGTQRTNPQANHPGSSGHSFHISCIHLAIRRYRPLLSLARISSIRQLRCTVSFRHCKLLRLLSHCHCPLPRRKGTSQPSIKRLAITSIMPASCFASSHVESPNLGCPNPPSQAENGGIGWARGLGLEAKMATSAPSPPSRLENWDLGQKRDFAPNP